MDRYRGALGGFPESDGLVLRRFSEEVGGRNIHGVSNAVIELTNNGYNLEYNKEVFTRDD